MFSSDSFIQLVFANMRDTYYCGGLLKLNLNQYLWMNLHEKYDIVYFLSKNGDLLYVDSFGDKNASSFSYNSGGFNLLTNKQKKFSNWMKDQLTLREKKAAFVCEAEDFCNIIENDLWRNAFSAIADIKRRTGTIILTMPPVVEQSRKYLMNSKLFDILKDNTVLYYRGDNIVQDYYSVLKREKSESCVFLNVFTKDKVSAMLECIVFTENKDRYLTSDTLDLMADYLTQYMNNKRLQWKDDLFDKNFNIVNPLYSEVYDQLKRDSVWNRLTKLAERVSKAGGIRRYARESVNEYVEEDSSSVRIFYSHGSSMWKCMSLCPAKYDGKENILNINAVDLLYDICLDLSKPRNSSENDTVSKAIDYFVLKINNAHSLGDIGTYKRALYSIRFFVQCLYVSSESEDDIGKIINRLKEYIDLSYNVCIAKKHFESFSGGKLKLQKKLMAQYEAHEILLNKYDEIIPASITASLRSSYGSTSEFQTSVSDLLNDLEKIQEETDVPVSQNEDSAAVSEAVLSDTEDYIEEYEIDDNLTNFRPPSI